MDNGRTGCVKRYNNRICGLMTMGLVALHLVKIGLSLSDDSPGGQCGNLSFRVSHAVKDLSGTFAKVRRVRAPTGTAFGKLHRKSLLGYAAFPGMKSLEP